MTVHCQNLHNICQKKIPSKPIKRAITSAYNMAITSAIIIKYWMIIFLDTHFQYKSTYWKAKHFPIHLRKPYQVNWQKLVLREKCDSVFKILNFGSTIQLSPNRMRNLHSHIHNCFTDVDYFQHITMATCDSGTLIDHLFTHNVCQADVTTEVIICYSSDHNIVARTIDVKHDIY